MLNSPIVATVFQMLELVVVFALVAGIAWVSKTWFNVDLTSGVELVAGLAIAGLAKFLRAEPSSPVPDYINKPMV